VGVHALPGKNSLLHLKPVHNEMNAEMFHVTTSDSNRYSARGENILDAMKVIRSLHILKEER